MQITDFKSGDKLAFTSVAQAGQKSVVGGSFGDLQEALNVTANAAGGASGAGGQVAAVAYGGNTYVVVDHSPGNGFNAATDQAIKLAGVTNPGVPANTSFAA